jgi:beta-galactosidase
MAVREPNGYHGKIHQTAWSVWPTWESWTWPSWEGKPIEVEVYTKSAWVNLYLNDELIGNKKVDVNTQFKATFSVPYKAGTLKAVDAEGHITMLATAGQPATLRLTADKTLLNHDGQDLVFITVEVVDSEGRLCPDAAIPCEAAVKGQGQLLAFASADLKDREPYTSPCVTTWKGRALLVVRSGKGKGKTQVTVKSSLPTTNITLK